MKKIVTDRLYLREAQLKDSRFFIDLMNTSGWLKYIGDRKIKTSKAAKDYIQHSLISSYEKNKFGLYVVVLRSTGMLIGICGLVKRPELSLPDLGFAILPEFESNGYTFEACKGVIVHSKETLSIPRILAITMPGNKKAVKLLERLGFTVVQNEETRHENKELITYTLDFN